ncbi:MAG: DNA-binding response regulator, partial [Betaproteobacteria bacterium]|nr:DNA-binding response regulator [Betaproteobacteria bacterium]
DGREAIRQILQLEPDVAVMDIAMPGLNGIEAVRAIREHGSKTRILMLSMHSTSEFVFRALEAGADGYVLKQCAGMEVVTAVRSVQAGRRYLSRAISKTDLAAAQDSAQASPLARLSTRESEVLQLVVEGKASAEIAGLLHLSPKSVDTYRNRVMKKLGTKDVTGLVKFALQHGLTTLD